MTLCCSSLLHKFVAWLSMCFDIDNFVIQYVTYYDHRQFWPLKRWVATVAMLVNDIHVICVCTATVYIHMSSYPCMVLFMSCRLRLHNYAHHSRLYTSLSSEETLCIAFFGCRVWGGMCTMLAKSGSFLWTADPCKGCLILLLSFTEFKINTNF